MPNGLSVVHVDNLAIAAIAFLAAILIVTFILGGWLTRQMFKQRGEV